jgi:hypothetical protein
MTGIPQCCSADLLGLINIDCSPGELLSSFSLSVIPRVLST